MNEPGEVTPRERALADLREALKRHVLACRLSPHDEALTRETREAVEAAQRRLAAVTSIDDEETT